jgi:voltage-gated potassium channel
MMFRPMRAMARDPEGKVLLGSAIALLATGTIVYTVLEGWSPLDALYFCVVTLATVGFGDLTPTTDLAKLFTVGYILTGIGILATFVSELGKYRGDAVGVRLRHARALDRREADELAGAGDEVARTPRDGPAAPAA